MRVFINFTKQGPIKFLSHLDFQRLWQKMFRIAGIQVQRTQGFNPHPKMRFAVPLATGFESVNELIEVFLENPMEMDELIQSLTQVTPHGVSIIAATEVPETFPKVTALVDALGYSVEVDIPSPTEKAMEERPMLDTGKEEVKLTDFILDIQGLDHKVDMVVKVDNQRTLRPDHIIRHLYPEISGFKVTRTKICFDSAKDLPIIPKGLTPLK